MNRYISINRNNVKLKASILYERVPTCTKSNPKHLFNLKEEEKNIISHRHHQHVKQNIFTIVPKAKSEWDIELLLFGWIRLWSRHVFWLCSALKHSFSLGRVFSSCHNNANCYPLMFRVLRCACRNNRR